VTFRPAFSCAITIRNAYARVCRVRRDRGGVSGRWVTGGRGRERKRMARFRAAVNHFVSTPALALLTGCGRMLGD